MGQALLTSFFTLIGAIILFGFSELARGLFIGPILKLRSHIGEVVDKVIFYLANLTSGNAVWPEEEKMIREQLMILATQLRAKEHMLPFYSFWARLHFVPKSSEIEICIGELI